MLYNDLLYGWNVLDFFFKKFLLHASFEISLIFSIQSLLWFLFLTTLMAFLFIFTHIM